MEDLQNDARARQLARQKKWRDENREHRAAYKKQWVAANAESVSEYNKAYQAVYQARTDAQFETWVRNLRRNYQMTPDQFNELWEKQDGKCPICECKLKPRGRTTDSVAVDHNHETGIVRGLLCRTCNRTLGLMKDSQRVLRRAADYLESRGTYEKS